MICDIATGLLIIAIFATNAISFLMGYKQREMELRKCREEY